MKWRQGILNDEWYQGLLFLALAIMIIGIPSSHILMSISQFSFGGIWLMHGRYREKWNAFIHDKAALAFTSIFLFHILGVFYSTDLEYALKDLRIKLPILIIPFMFSAFPALSAKKFQWLIYLFVGSVVTVSLYVTVVHLITREEVRLILSRDFISHIRFSLSMNLAIFSLILLHWNKQSNVIYRIVSALVVVYLLFFLLFLEAFTGVIMFVFVLFSLLVYHFFHNPRLWKKLSLALLVLLGVSSIGWYLFSFVEKNTSYEPFDIHKLDKYTTSGNPYLHNPDGGMENGKFLFVYLCEPEMREAWQQRSKLNFEGSDGQNQKLRYTLTRYMTSKGLRKDKEGMASLTDSDIRNIENGIANVNYTQGIGIEARLMKILFEYENYKITGDPSGHSVMQRIEYWKTSWSIIEKNFWFGVGTGDMNVAFQQEYELQNSKLDMDWRLRSHNQYLSIWVGFGIVGLLWFLFALIYAPIHNKSFHSLFYFVFFIIFMVSMLTEDTIESQAGVTFFVFFNALFLFLYRPENNLKLK